MERERGGTQPLGTVLKDVMKAITPRRTELDELSEAWNLAAGAEVAARTRVVGVTRETLTVSVESAALRQELESFREDDILARLQSGPGRRRIAKVRWVLKG